MREILFRGKLKSNGEWAFGNLDIKPNGVAIITPDDTLLGKYGAVDPVTVGQSIGLPDKNGQKIFEGDILHIEIHPHDNLQNVIASGNEVVEFKNGCFGVLWGFHRNFTKFDGFCYTTFEVIGNIHDNPELVEGKA